MKRVLLCPPSYYDIEYEINPWMHIENKVDQKVVKQEFALLEETYKDLGVSMWSIDQVAGLPDMVYSANFGFPIRNMFIKANFAFSERTKEANLAEEYFSKKGYEIEKLPENIAFEGQGDLLTAGGKYFFGWGKRSDKEAKDYLEEILESDVVDFKLVNPYYYHLDTCFAPLNDKTVVINPKSFEGEGISKIKELFPNVIEVSEQDNKLLACNLVVVQDTIVIASGISQSLKDDFAKFGFTTREVPTEEYRKGGGSVKCLTLEVY